MIGFTNTYLTTQEIFSHISYIGTDNINGVILLILTISISIVTINYILPALLILKEHLSKERKKALRKNMIKQISFQKEIEEEIEKNL